jgi:uncharacterized membrane protein (DUF373 family)
MLRLLISTERLLLYAVSLILLAIGAMVLALSVMSIITSREPWMERLIGSLEGLLLILIIVEIFLTVLNHLRGGGIQLEFFVVIGIIALVRHILSIVVRLAVPASNIASRRELLELTVDAGTIFLLVAALAVARWSVRRFDAGRSARSGPA